MNEKKTHILLVEDEAAHVELIRRAFQSRAGRVRLTVARTLQEARASLARAIPDLAIVDLYLPDGKGSELLPAEGEKSSYPIVMMTSQGDEQAAVEAIRAGALDYVAKSRITLADMPHIAERALREWAHIVERRRTEATWQALNAAATALQRAGLSEAQVYQAATEQLTALGLRGIVILLDEASASFVLAHFFVSAELLRALERLTGLTGARLRFPRARLPPYSRVVESGQAAYIADSVARFMPKLLPEPVSGLAGRIVELLGPANAILAPLRVEGRVAGLLHVAADWLNDANLPAITAFADQLSAALENARLFAETSKRADQMAIVHTLGQQITPLLDVDELLQTAAEALHARFGYLSVQLYLLDQAAGELEARAVAGEAGLVVRGYRQKVGEGITGRVAERGERVLIGDVSCEPGFIPCVPGIQSELVLPIRVAGEMAGVLNVESDQLHGFDQADVIALEALADRIGAALDNARLFEAEREQRALSEALRAAAAALNSSLDFDEVLEQILANVGRVVPHDAADIMLVEDGIARIVGTRGYARRGPEAFMRGLRFPVADTANLRQMAATGQPLAIPDTHADPDWVVVPETRWIRSHAGAPIRLKGEVIGFLSLDSARPGFFTLADAGHLQIFANQAAIAIENARLHAALRDHSANLEAQVAERTTELTYRAGQLAHLQELGVGLLGAASLDETLQLVARGAVTRLGYDYAAVGLRHEEEQALVIRAVYPLNPRIEKVRALLPTPKGELLRLPLTGGSPAAQQALSGETMVVTSLADFAAPSIPRAVADGLQKLFGIGCLHSVPLLDAGEVVGVLMGIVRAPELSRQQQQSLTLLAGQAALAIQQARLYEAEAQRIAELKAERDSLDARVAARTAEITRRNRQLLVLQSAGAAITSSLELPTVLERILASALELVESSNAHIYVYDQDSGAFTLGAALHQSGDRTPAVDQPRPAGLTATVARAGQPLVINDAPSHPLYTAPEVRAWEVRAIAGYPLKSGARVVGVLTVAYLVPHTFTEEELRLLELLANQAASAIENARLYEEVQQLAITDSLTGLYNRRYFERQLTAEFQRARRYARPLALIMLDLDHLKQINDRYGHPAGDAALVKFASLLRVSVRETDVAARYGGDEFVVILPETDLANAASVATKICEAIAARPFAVDRHTLHITASVGVSALPDQVSADVSQEKLVRQADQALYEAKHTGRNQVRGVSV